jgi:hypothetical protein
VHIDIGIGRGILVYERERVDVDCRPTASPARRIAPEMHTNRSTTHLILLHVELVHVESDDGASWADTGSASLSGQCKC